MKYSEVDALYETTMIIFYTLTAHPDTLEVCLGDSKGQHVLLKVPSVAVLNEFQQITTCGPLWEASKSAKSLMSIFWSDEDLAESCCTYANGWKLLDQRILLGIKCIFLTALLC